MAAKGSIQPAHVSVARAWTLNASRRVVNDAFLRDLRDHWAKHGVKILDRVAEEAPGTYMKVMALLMPRELKVESTQQLIGGLSDEALHAMLAKLQEQIAEHGGKNAKLINGTTVPSAPTHRPEPWKPHRRKRKSTLDLEQAIAESQARHAAKEELARLRPIASSEAEAKPTEVLPDGCPTIDET